VFTGTLLAEMAQRGEVALDEPIDALLPAGVSAPSRNGRRITLQDLATHTSGLPRLPANLVPGDQDDPYADYEPEQLYDFLSRYTLTRDVGAAFEYSNEGAGLLGHLLSLRAGRGYGDLVRERILAPAGMTSTVLDMPPQLRERCVTGHDEQGRAVAHWNFTTLAGAGGLRASAADMLSFAAAGLGGSDLGRAIRTAQAPRFEIDAQSSIGLHWLTDRRHGHEIVWHDGGTGGFAGFLGIDRAGGTAAVVLSNTFGSFADIGMHVLDERMELAELHRAVMLPAAVLERYVGEYAGPDGPVTLTACDGALTAESPGLLPLRLLAIDAATFFIRADNALVTFELDSRARATAAVLDGGGSRIRFTKTR
jgi:serine-type D-Ala-D-Ala carboxypeptidase/endopeptidase